MLRIHAYRFELIPNAEQKRKMRQFAGSARYVFNRALAIQQKERERTGRKRSGYAALCKMLTGWRNHPETTWLRDGRAGAAIASGMAPLQRPQEVQDRLLIGG